MNSKGGVIRLSQGTAKLSTTACVDLSNDYGDQGMVIGWTWCFASGRFQATGKWFSKDCYRDSVSKVVVRVDAEWDGCLLFRLVPMSTVHVLNDTEDRIEDGWMRGDGGLILTESQAR